MFVYSKKIITFINEVKTIIKAILSQEIHKTVSGDRFYTPNGNSYPISVVIYNNKSMLGYFCSDFYELGFHECLMHSSKEQLRNVIRHELAHYFTFIQYRNSIAPHSPPFREFCVQMGWGEDVFKATTCWDGAQNALELEKSGVLRKVQKLMALSSSSNQNESEQAMIKSQQLLVKHNIESQYIENADEEKSVLKRIMKQKRENAKMRAVAQILKTFFVNIVYNRGGEHTYLEISGNVVNVEIAEYVANFLEQQLDKLWSQAQKQHTNLKGTVAKNSFFLGISRGYCEKINHLTKEYNQNETKALIVIEKQLANVRDLIYKRLSSHSRSANYCPESLSLGQQVGRQLNINPALNHEAKNSKALLT